MMAGEGFEVVGLVLGAVAVVIGLPLLAAGAIAFGLAREQVRKAALVPTGVAMLAAITASVAWYSGHGTSAAVFGPQLGGGHVIQIDGLSMLLLPFVAVLHMATLAVAPRRELTAKAAFRLLCGGSFTSMFFVTAHPVAILVLWLATAWPAWAATKETEAGRPAARVYAGVILVSFASLALGVMLMLQDPPWVSGSGITGDLGGWLVALSVVMRKGIFPFHSWYPLLFARGPLAAALMATMPQVAAYTAIRLLVGHADGVSTELVTLSQLAFVTTAYGAALAMVQRSLRGLIGTLAMSQSAMVLAGLAGTLPMELNGALCMWISSGLSLTGIGLVAWSLESREGPISIASPQGLFREAPELAGWFLMFGLAGFSFPGTLAFVADDLIVSASLDDQLHAGLLVIATHVFSGIALVRAWFHMFGGPQQTSGRGHPTLPRERLTMIPLICLIFALGLYPHLFVTALEQTAAGLLRQQGSVEHGEVADEIHAVP